MSTQHIATAAFVKVSIGSPSGNRVAQLIQRGSVVPGGVDEAQLERLVDRGLIEAVDVEDIEVTEEDEDLDEGVYKGVKVADLKADLAKRNEGREGDAVITPTEPGHRPQIVAALLADDAE
ncbi:hypothetical protein [Microbacterium oxydans]|uniref:hypothetical protein n=1 Tax=Microbacterium oxydans TaxID=82380 RepID=UPI000F8F8F08|nr:hypothetical protein [Microbacterium oxydans]AZS46670.1 hypothetical protein CVS53_01344 [Microbacterium oxydans]